MPILLYAPSAEWRSSPSTSQAFRAGRHGSGSPGWGSSHSPALYIVEACLSVGVSVVSSLMLTLSALVDAADTALLEASGTGMTCDPYSVLLLWLLPGDASCM